MLDLDGTSVIGDDVNKGMCKVLARIPNWGIVTGRGNRYQALYPFKKVGLNTTGPVIVSGGSILYCYQGKRQIELLLSEQQKKHILTLMKGSFIDRIGWGDVEGGQFNVFSYDQDLLQRLGLKYATVDIFPHFDLYAEKMMKGKVAKISIGFTKPEFASLMPRGLKSYATKWEGSYWHETAVGDKGSALRQMMKMFNISPSEVLIAGDGNNDIPAFEVSEIKYRVAVGDNERLIDLSTHQVSCPSGLADLLECLMLR